MKLADDWNQGSKRRAGPDPSKYLRSRSMDPSLSEAGTSQGGVVTEQPKPSNFKPKSYHLEQERPPTGDDDWDEDWEFIGKVRAYITFA